VLGCDISTLVTSGKLVWMPAHKSLKAIGETKKGDGTRITAADWRANGLVDAFAKQAAEHLQATPNTIRLVESAEAAAAHAACILGVVTHAGNNHSSCAPSDGGSSTTVTLRDSTDVPKAKRGATSTAVPTAVDGGLTAPACANGQRLRVVLPWLPPTPKVHANRLRRAASEGALTGRIEATGATLAPRRNGASAADRIDAVTRRGRCRATHTPTREGLATG
jgi:hypothetical protein